MSKWLSEGHIKDFEKEIAKEDEEAFEGVEYWLDKDINGWEAYHALYRVLLRWFIVSKEDYAAWLATSLYSDPALYDDFARALKSALRKMEEGQRKNALEKASDKKD